MCRNSKQSLRQNTASLKDYLNIHFHTLVLKKHGHVS
jgi:hypothetical protein